MVSNKEAGGSYLQTMQEELEETRKNGEEANREAENWKTEETSETCERDGSESKSEDIDSWRNLERDMMFQQEMCKDVMAAVTMGKEIRESMPVRGRKRANWMGFEGRQVRTDDGSGE